MRKLKSHRLANSACIHSDSPFPVTVIMDKLSLCWLELGLQREPLGRLLVGEDCIWHISLSASHLGPIYRL